MKRDLPAEQARGKEEAPEPMAKAQEDAWAVTRQGWSLSTVHELGTIMDEFLPCVERRLPPMQLPEHFTYERHHKPNYDAMGHEIVDLVYKRHAEEVQASFVAHRAKPWRRNARCVQEARGREEGLADSCAAEVSCCRDSVRPCAAAHEWAHSRVWTALD